MSINALIQKTLWTVKWTVLYSSVAVSGRTKTILEYTRKTTHRMSCTIELLCLKHTFDRINCFGGYITRGVICNWFTYIPGNVGVSSMSQEKVHNGGVALLTGHTEWSRSSLCTKLVIIYSMNRANGMS